MGESESAFDQPTPEQIAAFVDGDPIAEDEVIRLILPQLCSWAHAEHPTLPCDELDILIFQVLAETCRPRVRYDPSKSLLTTYVINLFNLRVKDLYSKHNELLKYEVAGLEVRENFAQAQYNDLGAPELRLSEITREEFFQRARESLSPIERDVLDLIRAGEKSEDVFGAVLDRHGTTRDSRSAHEVKNLKVRILRRMKVIAQELGYRIDDLLQ